MKIESAAAQNNHIFFLKNVKEEQKKNAKKYRFLGVFLTGENGI